MTDTRTTDPEHKTFAEMCETIVKANLLQKKDGSAPTAEEIFNYSPSGELFMVFAWYDAAKAVLRGREGAS